jgi:hypothetical protein
VCRGKKKWERGEGAFIGRGNKGRRMDKRQWWGRKLEKTWYVDRLIDDFHYYYNLNMIVMNTNLGVLCAAST